MPGLGHVGGPHPGDAPGPDLLERGEHDLLPPHRNRLARHAAHRTEAVHRAASADERSGRGRSWAGYGLEGGCRRIEGCSFVAAVGGLGVCRRPLGCCGGPSITTMWGPARRPGAQPRFEPTQFPVGWWRRGRWSGRCGGIVERAHRRGSVMGAGVPGSRAQRVAGAVAAYLGDPGSGGPGGIAVQAPERCRGRASSSPPRAGEGSGLVAAVWLLVTVQRTAGAAGCRGPWRFSGDPAAGCPRWIAVQVPERCRGRVIVAAVGGRKCGLA